MALNGMRHTVLIDVTSAPNHIFDRINKFYPRKLKAKFITCSHLITSWPLNLIIM
jgi:hypothetical protein